MIIFCWIYGVKVYYYNEFRLFVFTLFNVTNKTFEITYGYLLFYMTPPLSLMLLKSY